MLDFSFLIEKAAAVPFAAVPTLGFTLRVLASPAEHDVQNIMLRCQVRIEPTRRRYEEAEQGKLSDLFGPPHEWSRTLRSLLWTHASVVVPPFRGTTTVELPIACTFDFNVAATKYFDGLEQGEVPLTFLFSGTVFYQGAAGRLQVMQIPWDREASFALPVSVWKAMMEHYYPQTAWLALRKDVFDRLHRFKREQAMPTWEQALEALLNDREACAEARP